VATGREKLFDFLAVTGGAGDFFVSKDQDFKVLVAFRTVILENGHYDELLTKISFLLKNIKQNGLFVQP
jgi:hypothetical protein